MSVSSEPWSSHVVRLFIPAGVPLSERDPGAVSELLLPDQSERGSPGREGHGPAGHPRQGRSGWGGLGEGALQPICLTERVWFNVCVCVCVGFQPAVLPAVQDPVQRTQPPDQLGPGPAAAEAGLQQVLHPVGGHPGQVRVPGRAAPNGPHWVWISLRGP